MKKTSILCFLTVLCATLFLCTACGWVGKTAGHAGAKIEKNVDEMKQGYEEGYNS